MNLGLKAPNPVKKASGTGAQDRRMSLSGCQSYGAVLGFCSQPTKQSIPFPSPRCPSGSARKEQHQPTSSTQDFILCHLAKHHSRIFNEEMLVTKYPYWAFKHTEFANIFLYNSCLEAPVVTRALCEMLYTCVSCTNRMMPSLGELCSQSRKRGREERRTLGVASSGLCGRSLAKAGLAVVLTCHDTTLSLLKHPCAFSVLPSLS